MTLARLIACYLALILWAGQAHAEAIRVELVATALQGKGTPQLVVQVLEKLDAVEVSLKADDGTTVQRTFRRPKKGRLEVALAHKPGTATWTGRLTIRFPGGDESSMPLSFQTTLSGPPVVTAEPDAVDLTARQVTVSVDRPGGRIELVVTSDEGVTLAKVAREFPEAAAGATRVLSWTQPDTARVMRLDVRAIDSSGLYSDLELYPWRIDVPHEDVLFETGRAEIREEEVPKLEAAWKELKAALDRYGRFAKVRLFVAGHTDTVGDAAANQALSEARAMAIARWFRRQGMKVPVSYAGLGESILLVPTADETDEPRNRRAEYVVAVVPPAGVRWKSLP